VVGAVDAEGRQKSLVAESRGWRGSIVGWGCRGEGCMVGGCDGEGGEEEDAMVMGGRRKMRWEEDAGRGDAMGGSRCVS
jgi:hypothetical protein